MNYLKHERIIRQIIQLIWILRIIYVYSMFKASKRYLFCHLVLKCRDSPTHAASLQLKVKNWEWELSISRDVFRWPHDVSVIQKKAQMTLLQWTSIATSFETKSLGASEMRGKKTQTVYNPICLLWQGVMFYFYFLPISALLPVCSPM